MTRERIAAAILALAARAHALPDLAPEVEEVRVERNQTVNPGDFAEGCAGGRAGRTLVRFGVRFRNYGPDPLFLGDPGCPDCATHPGAACADPRYECSPADGHRHPHFVDFARYELVDLAGRVLAQGGKRTFCARDSGCPDGVALAFTCDVQGLGVGCSDYYPPDLGCQYVDATDVPEVARGAFRIRVTYDPDHRLPDGDRADDVFEYPPPGCGDGAVAGREECDPGVASQPCCNEICRLRPAGTACRPAADACDAAELCDGTAPDCPPDGGLADGAACGGALPCRPATCAAGVCIAAALEPGWCLIEDACVPSAARGPDACSICDPAADAGAWTRVLSADAAGLRCRLDDVRVAVARACPTPTGARIVRRIDAMAARLGRATPAAFSRACQRFVRATRHTGCVADGEALLAQARAWAASARRAGGPR